MSTWNDNEQLIMTTMILSQSDNSIFVRFDLGFFILALNNQNLGGIDSLCIQFTYQL